MEVTGIMLGAVVLAVVFLYLLYFGVVKVSTYYTKEGDASSMRLWHMSTTKR